jgi:predicted dehydrogenase
VAAALEAIDADGIATDLLYHRLVPFLVTLGPQFPLRVSSNGGIYVHKDREVPDTVSTTIEYPEFQVIMSSSMAADLPGAHRSPIIYGHEGTIEFRGKELVITPEPIYAKPGKEPLDFDIHDLVLTSVGAGQPFNCSPGDRACSGLLPTVARATAARYQPDDVW